MKRLKNNVYSFEKARFMAALKTIEGTYHPDNRENGWTVSGGYQIGMYDEQGFPILHKPVTTGHPVSMVTVSRSGVSVGLLEFIKQQFRGIDDRG